VWIELIVNLTFVVVYAGLSVSLKNFELFLIQETVNALLLVFSGILFIHMFLKFLSKLLKNEETLPFC